jgi:glycosyltransferase involved in cell wall biosynthesis
MKILHLIPRLIGGGPERSIMAIAAKSAELGAVHQRTLAVIDAPVSPRMLIAARKLGIRVVIRPDPQAILRLITETDILHINYWNHPLLTALLRQADLPPARVVVCSHVLGTAAPQVLTAALGRFADHLILTGELTRESEGARAAAAAGKTVQVISAVSDMNRLEGFARRPHDGCVVGYLGAVNDAKMHPRFAEMAAGVQYPGVRFVVYGGGGGKDALRRRLAALGLGARAAVMGHVDDVRSAFEQMDVFGYPLMEHTYASSERALQEAMWVGIPPVVFAHGGVRLLVEHERTGLVASTEAEYIAAIERLVRDAVLRDRLGRNARAFARENFDPAVWTRKTINLLEQAAAGPRRARERLDKSAVSAAQGFIASLGECAGPFAVSYAGSASGNVDAAVESADCLIAASNTLLARGEGGVIHYRKEAPDDPHLRLWSGLVAEASGQFALADSEYEAAGRLGLKDARPGRYRERCVRPFGGRTADRSDGATQERG